MFLDGQMNSQWRSVKSQEYRSALLLLACFYLSLSTVNFYLWCEKLMKGNSILIKNSLPQGQRV
jgi:hypothetical protein